MIFLPFPFFPLFLSFHFCSFSFLFPQFRVWLYRKLSSLTDGKQHSVTTKNGEAAIAIPDLYSKNSNFPNHMLGKFASKLMGSATAFSMVVWSNFKSKLKRTLIYHSASCYLLFLLHPLPPLGIMIKQRSSRISWGQRFLCAPSFALTSSNLVLAVSVRTIVIEVASGYYFFEKFLLLLKLFVARAKYVKLSPASILQVLCWEGERGAARELPVQFTRCRSQASSPKDGWPMGPSECLDSISAQHFFSCPLYSNLQHAHHLS